MLMSIGVSVPSNKLPFGLIGEETLVISHLFFAGSVLLRYVFFVGHALIITNCQIVNCSIVKIILRACRYSANRGSRY